jgi:hypothetical protein
MPSELPSMPERSRNRGIAGSLVLMLAAAAIIGFYAWDAAPDGSLFRTLNGGSSYYSLLVKGFRAGHLSLDVAVPPGLAQLSDPYDPKQNAPFGMHDVSYYKGRFYLYFGVTPAVVLYWPFYALTGHFLEDTQVVFVFCSLGFLTSSVLLLLIRRQYFPSLGLGSELAGLLAVGLANMVPVLLRRTQVYEVAVSSAFAFFTLALLGLYQSMHGSKKASWMAVSSVAFGLAVGSRPTYLFGAACLLLPAWFAFSRRRSDGEQTSWRMLAVAAIAPFCAVISGLLLYNALRFGNPLEFGQRLAFSGANETKVTHFSLSYFVFNCRAYLFAPAQMSSYFPFVRVIWLPASPAGQFGVEDPYGILPDIPFAILALLAPLAWIRRPALKVFILGVGIASFLAACVIFTFQFATNRYMVDFLPGFVILSAVGFWGLVENFSGLSRKMALGAGYTLLAWSVLFNVFAAFGHNELLRVNDPAVFRRLVHAFGWPRQLYDQAFGRTYGPLEVKLKFPSDKMGKVEPLVITGNEFLSDYLYAYYSSEKTIVIGFEHAGYGGPVTKAIPMDYSAPHRLLVDMPTLYPPIGDPYFDDVPDATLAVFGSHLRVWLDGDEIVDVPQQFHPSFSTKPGVGGGSRGQWALGQKFTGEILHSRLLKPDWDALTKAAHAGPLVISLEFPENSAGKHEPIVTSGVAGRGDVLVVNYLNSNHATFALDHWGYGGPVSGPIEIKPGTRQTLEVRFGSFFPESDRPRDVPIPQWSAASEKLELSLDGHQVYEVKTPFYQISPDDVIVGKNPIGASSCVAEFSGRIYGSIRTDIK